MREAIRRPTGDGVLDSTLELLALALVLCLGSLLEFLPGVSSSMKTPCGQSTAAPLSFLEFGLLWPCPFALSGKLFH